MIGDGHDLWLNVGCGLTRGPAPWTNCDVYAGVKPDVLFDATQRWPFPDGIAARMLLSQVLEHLEWPVGVMTCLIEARRVLADHGELVIFAPDLAGAVEHHAPPDVIHKLRVGEQRWPGDEHLWFCDRHVLVADVRQVFPAAEVVNPRVLACDFPFASVDAWSCAIKA